MPISETEDPRRTHAESPKAALAHELVLGLQHHLIKKLKEVAIPLGDAGFAPIDWLRDEGRHGGGRRYAAAQSNIFNRASINISGVHYDDLDHKKLRSATALSTIIHPENPHAPSMHMHISWTELRDGRNYWRVMADLNPALDNPDAKANFDDALQEAAPHLFEEATEAGDRYFFIPALDRHRGVSHYYLEGYQGESFAGDQQFAKAFGESIIECYAEILHSALLEHPQPTDKDYAAQRTYHTIYFLQVLTLDRGTTSGILVHDQNDVGILASLPSFIDRDLLRSWRSRLEAPQNKLLENLIDALPDETPTPLTDDTRQRLAKVVRRHYKEHPEALRMQASGTKNVPTVDNHRG